MTSSDAETDSKPIIIIIIIIMMDWMEIETRLDHLIHFLDSPQSCGMDTLSLYKD